jgi:hypothetical protein
MADTFDTMNTDAQLQALFQQTAQPLGSLGTVMSGTQNAGAAVDAQIRQAYLKFLGREPTPAEILSHTGNGQFRLGDPRILLSIQNISRSPEAQARQTGQAGGTIDLNRYPKPTGWDNTAHAAVMYPWPDGTSQPWPPPNAGLKAGPVANMRINPQTGGMEGQLPDGSWEGLSPVPEVRMNQNPIPKGTPGNMYTPPREGGFTGTTIPAPIGTEVGVSNGNGGSWGNYSPGQDGTLGGKWPDLNGKTITNAGLSGLWNKPAQQTNTGSTIPQIQTGSVGATATDPWTNAEQTNKSGYNKNRRTGGW